LGRGGIQARGPGFGWEGSGGVSIHGLVPAGQGPCPQLRMLEDEAEKGKK